MQRRYVTTGRLNTVRKTTDASEEVGLEINAEKTKYMAVCFVTRIQDKL